MYVYASVYTFTHMCTYLAEDLFKKIDWEQCSLSAAELLRLRID